MFWKRKQYTYHVAHGHLKNGDTGFGSSTCRTNKPINTIAQLLEIAEGIKTEQGFDRVVILNVMRLKS